MNRVYAYVRVSTKSQSIARQINAIKEKYPNAEILAEKYTGTKIDGREVWLMLRDKAEPTDTIIFDSVSRMSRNANEGINDYLYLYNLGVELIFLNEPHINTSMYSQAKTNQQIKMRGTDEDLLFQGINAYIERLATRQIKLAFEQAEKEVNDIKKRCEGGRQAKKTKTERKGKQLNIYKESYIKGWIKKYSKDFDGALDDKRTQMNVLNEIELHNEQVQKSWNNGTANESTDKMINKTLSRNTYYKYKKELLTEINNNTLNKD